MYPYIEIFGIQVSMMMVWVIVAAIVFLVTVRILTKRNHQDFLKLFYRLPWWIILSYILWRYISFSLETGIYIPSSLSHFVTILSLQNFNFHFVWLILASLICLSLFFSTIKRTENKKIWSDIIFLSMANALIVLWIFITLWDSVVWNPTDSIFAVRALSDNSALTKFDGVYPIWLFISFWVLVVHVVVSILSIVLKKNGLWMWWMIWILIVLNVVFLFQSYPRYWLVSVFWTSFDVKQYVSFVVIIIWIIVALRWDRKRF